MDNILHNLVRINRHCRPHEGGGYMVIFSSPDRIECVRYRQNLMAKESKFSLKDFEIWLEDYTEEFGEGIYG